MAIANGLIGVNIDMRHNSTISFAGFIWPRPDAIAQMAKPASTSDLRGRAFA